MQETEINLALSNRLKIYIALVGLVGTAWMVYLLLGVQWEASTLGEFGLFTLLLVVAGGFPLPVAPRVKTDVTTAIWICSALVMEPGVAALSGVAGIVIYSIILKLQKNGPNLRWYKYPFNVGQLALAIGLAGVTFEALSSGDTVLSPAVAPAILVMYMANTSLVSIAASLQIGVNPLRIWWMGTRENGLAELSLFAFGFLGAVVFRESPWTLVALVVPVTIIYVAFSGLARANTRLQDALEKLESLQGKIVSTSKLASVGAISLDLAHQIKNPLSILLGRLEELQDHLSGGTKAARHLEIAEEAGWRIHELTETFSSIGQHKWIKLDVRELLDEAYGMAAIRLRNGVELRRDYQTGTLDVSGNPVLIREALSNLICNAMESVEENGLITIAAFRDESSIVTTISDNGVGIPNRRLATAFEPFNTTKPNGHGLGLFAAKHIVEMHHGTVGLHSVEGEGTRVTVRLPATSQAEGNADPMEELYQRNGNRDFEQVHGD